MEDPGEKACGRRDCPPTEEESDAPPASCPDSVAGFARTVYALLEKEPRHIDELAVLCGQPSSLVLAALTQLEIAGCAVGESGQRYRRV